MNAEILPPTISLSQTDLSPLSETQPICPRRLKHEVLTEMSNLGFGFTEQERGAHTEALAHVKIKYRIDLQVCWFQCKQPPVPTTINNFTSTEVCWFTTINNF